jgi:sirohydrochlorin cobaltochelatase
MKAVILLGHGSRDPLWRQPIEAVAQRLHAAHPEIAVHCAYLELEQPDLAAAAAIAVRDGAQELTVMPLFLGTGKHAREDLPRLVQELRRQHPAARVTLRKPVGDDPRVLELLAAIAAE